MVGVEGVFDKIDKVTREMEEACKLHAGKTAAKMEKYAKENRRWKDRTGDARKGLTGKAVHSKDGVSAEIWQDLYGESGGKYGYYLETAHDGRYAILDETAQEHASYFFDGLATALSALLRG